MKRDSIYLALGDSLTVGFGAPQGQGFVDHYHTTLQQKWNKEVACMNHGVNGATSGDILELIRRDADIHAFIRKAEVITLTAGGNDLLQAAIPYIFEGKTNDFIPSLVTFQRNYKKIVADIQAIKRGSAEPFTFKLIGLYNPIPSVQASDFWVKVFNRHISKCAGRRFHFVNVYDAFVGKETEYLYEDQVHPNELGYQVINEQVKKTDNP